MAGHVGEVVWWEGSDHTQSKGRCLEWFVYVCASRRLCRVQSLLSDLEA